MQVNLHLPQRRLMPGAGLMAHERKPTASRVPHSAILADHPSLPRSGSGGPRPTCYKRNGRRWFVRWGGDQQFLNEIGGDGGDGGGGYLLVRLVKWICETRGSNNVEGDRGATNLGG
jgi:hypothetical protein